MKLTVKEYANKHKISLQSVYKKVKNNSLKWFKENGKTYIYEEIEAHNISSENDFQPIKPKVENILNQEFKIQELKLQHKIALLEKELELKNEILQDKENTIMRVEQTLKSQLQTIEAEQRTNMALTHNLKNIENLQLESKKKHKKFLGIFSFN